METDLLYSLLLCGDVGSPWEGKEVCCHSENRVIFDPPNKIPVSGRYVESRSLFRSGLQNLALRHKHTSYLPCGNPIGAAIQLNIRCNGASLPNECLRKPRFL